MDKNTGIRTRTGAERLEQQKMEIDSDRWTETESRTEG